MKLVKGWRKRPIGNVLATFPRKKGRNAKRTEDEKEREFIFRLLKNTVALWLLGKDENLGENVACSCASSSPIMEWSDLWLL